MLSSMCGVFWAHRTTGPKAERGIRIIYVTRKGLSCETLWGLAIAQDQQEDLVEENLLAHGDPALAELGKKAGERRRVLCRPDW